MGYLIPGDYLMQIQPQFRAQLNPSALYKAELAAIEEINGFLSKKYLTTSEFTNTALYIPSAVYAAYSRVYISYATYNTATSYTAGQYCTFNFTSYIANKSTTGTFDAAAWDVISNIYFVPYPQPLFNVYAYYNIGDMTYWNGSIYTAKQGTKTLSNVQAQQYGEVDNVPLNNIFPDDKYNGGQWWTNNGDYSIPAGAIGSAQYSASIDYSVGTVITFTDNNIYRNTTAITGGGETWNPDHWQMIWQCGDNRSQLMVTHMINVSLYWAHYAIASNNIPDKIGEGYDIAKSWMRGVMDGKITTPLQAIQPKKGQHILMDSQVKRGQYY